MRTQPRRRDATRFGSRIASAFLCGALFVLGAAAGSAQDKAAPDKESTALAKATQNPVADLVTIPAQFNFFSGGDLSAQTLTQFLVQPVMPLVINEKWNVIARTIVPFVSVPLPGGQRSAGIADIQEQLYFTPAKPGKIIWGIGPLLSLPTATNTLLATGQLALGPTAVILAMPGPWVVGALANNIWRISGNDQTTEINQFFLQPFINYNLARGWAISTAPAITANWSAPSGEEWTLPVGLGISKIDRIGSRPVNLGLQYYHLAEHPSGAADEQWRFVFALLYPRAK